MNAACSRRVSLIIAGGLPAIPSPTISATTGDHPAASGFMPAPTGFAFRSKARPSTPTESSSRRLATRQACVMDWSFSFRCSPPRLTATQLRFDTARFFTAQERTFTALSPRLLRRTSAEFMPLQLLKCRTLEIAQSVAGCGTLKRYECRAPLTHYERTLHCVTLG
jgi:hypothetical protein